MISEYKLKLIDKKLLETKLKEMKNLTDNNLLKWKIYEKENINYCDKFFNSINNCCFICVISF